MLHLCVSSASPKKGWHASSGNTGSSGRGSGVTTDLQDVTNAALCQLAQAVEDADSHHSLAIFPLPVIFTSGPHEHEKSSSFELTRLRHPKGLTWRDWTHHIACFFNQKNRNEGGRERRAYHTRTRNCLLLISGGTARQMHLLLWTTHACSFGAGAIHLFPRSNSVAVRICSRYPWLVVWICGLGI